MVVEEPPPRPPNQGVISQENYAIGVLDPLQVMQNIYSIIEKALRYHDPNPYYHTMMMMMIQEEMHPVTELHIVWNRRRKEGGGRTEPIGGGSGWWFLSVFLIVYF